MHPRDPIPLKRAVQATLIPYGGTISIPEGSTVTVTQALGGSYSVLTELGQMARIEGKDADALGLTPPPAEATGAPVAPTDRAGVEKAVWDQLKTCYDPEIPVNIVDLGLVFANEVSERAEADGGGYKAGVKFTLTAPGCGMGGILQKEIETKLAAIPGVKEVKADLVFEPVWDKNMMSEAAKLRLGIF